MNALKERLNSLKVFFNKFARIRTSYTQSEGGRDSSVGIATR